MTNLPKQQSINSVESAKTVITEEPEKKESLLPDKPPKDQYEFAVSFMKIGDYETAEFALREFIDKNKDHELAGSAQYWYGETFRIRQLYSDAATAYLDGYQNYPKSKKAPDNLLKLGITMVQLGEKDQGCKMILGLKKEYPKASKSVLQKAQYEQKNSSVILKSGFKNFEDLSKVYLNFKHNFKKLKYKSYVIAISGGPDSLALAALAKALSYERKLKFYNVLVDHQIRHNSKKEANQVKLLLKKHRFSCKIISNKSKIIKNIQSQARDIRYEILKNFCKKKKVKIILTAHNLEDQVETFFIRLSRGSGITGLSGMKIISKLDKDISLFRPLLDVKKDFDKNFQKIFGKYFKDPSNKNMKYLRTKIRNLETPLQRSGVNYDQIIKSIKNLASSKETLDEYFEGIFKEIVKIHENEVLINWKKFKTLNLEMKIKTINSSIKILKNNYYNPRASKVSDLIEQLETNKYERFTLAKCQFVRKKDQLSLKSEKN